MSSVSKRLLTVLLAMFTFVPVAYVPVKWNVLSNQQNKTHCFGSGFFVVLGKHIGIDVF